MSLVLLNDLGLWTRTNERGRSLSPMLTTLMLLTSLFDTAATFFLRCAIDAKMIKSA